MRQSYPVVEVATVPALEGLTNDLDVILRCHGAQYRARDKAWTELGWPTWAMQPPLYAACPPKRERPPGCLMPAATQPLDTPYARAILRMSLRSARASIAGAGY
jgi:hypothetical protein